MAFKREDVIWAAGLFEGEGTITLSKLPSGKHYPRIKVKMTDEDSVAKFASIFDMKYSPVQEDKSWQDHWKPAWYTDCTGKKAYAVLMAMWPWLGKRRQARAIETIQLWCKN